jgi:predicted patatin/cPLA2 family phospholipase
VVVLTREAGFVKKPENAKMAEIRYHKYPEFVQALQNRHVVYNHSLEVLKEMERAGQAFVIQPDKKLDISRMENDIEVIQQVYDLGGKDARIRMKALKDWMKQ